MPALTAEERHRAIHRAIGELSDRNPSGGITHIAHFPARPAKYADFPDSLAAPLREACVRRGVKQLYTHQREVVDRVEAGADMAIVTPTASGKTLCYNLPVLNRILREPDARALYLFPTKALSRDQCGELLDLAREAGPEIRADVFDGDTPGDARRRIRTRAHIVITNPDMLHAGILPNHTRWAKMFENLRYLVVDEMHTYRGVFGSHVANILRRLHRVCRHYGSDPQFILSSATIANPGELAARLVGRPVELMTRSGGPRTERFFVFHNPPVVNPELGIRRSSQNEVRRLARGFLEAGLQTIVFARSRNATEVLVRYLKTDRERKPDRIGRIRGYRGGYLPKTRREIEQGIRDGTVQGVVSTNALELGIDIGGLDVAVMAGYPGTIASTWQQAGRAGRRGGAAAAVLVANSSPTNQFVIRNPDWFFGGSPERGLVNPDNLSILVEHVKCAAFELPFRPGETFGGENLDELLGVIEREGLLHHSGDRWYWTADSCPAHSVSLRSASSDNFVIHDRETNRILGEMDFVSAHSALHPKAIHMVESETWIVEELDHRNRRAEVRPVASDYYTDAITHTRVSVLDTFDRAPVPGIPGAHGEVHVVRQVVGFKKIRFHTGENVGSGDLDMPAVEMQTTAFWLEPPVDVLHATGFGPGERRGGIRGIRNALRAVAATLVMSEPNDIGVAVGSRDEEAGAEGAGPRIFIYDNYPGGVGLSEPLFNEREALLRETRTLIERCGCRAGCPSCVGPSEEVGPRGKAAALAILGGTA